MTDIANLFAGIPQDLPQEQIDALATSPHVRIERIVSRAHASPDGFWYDQDWAEWVAVLQGSAGLLFEGEAVPRTNVRRESRASIPRITRSASATMRAVPAALVRGASSVARW